MRHTACFGSVGPIVQPTTAYNQDPIDFQLWRHNATQPLHAYQ